MKGTEINLARARDTGQAMVLLLLLLILYKKFYFLLLPTIVVLVLNMTWPAVFMPLAKLWFGLAELLGWVMSRVLLSVVFALIVTPMGLLRRLLGKDPMRGKEWKKTTGSVLVTRDHHYKKEDLESPY